MEDQPKKAHRPRTAGAKAEKKQKSNAKNNPKACTGCGYDL
jgi:hypothetical protein